MQRQIDQCSSPGARACVVHLHRDEQNAAAASQQMFRESCVNLVTLGSGSNRNITIPGVRCAFHPNRIFSDNDTLIACHALSECRGTPAAKLAMAAQIRQWRDRDLYPALNTCSGAGTGNTLVTSPPLPVVAMHNNTPDRGLDVNWYRPTGRRSSAWSCLTDEQAAHVTADRAVTPNPSVLTAASSPIPGREDPDNFLLATRRADFNALSPRFNIVLQDPTAGAASNPANDASLAVAMAGAQQGYVNVEAEGKTFQAARYAFDLEMGREVLNHFGVPRRPAPAETCSGTATVAAGSACPVAAAQPQPDAGTQQPERYNNPTPVRSNPTPVRSNPTPVRSNPTPVRSNLR